MDEKLQKIAQYYSGSGWLVLEQSHKHIRVRREVKKMTANNWKIFSPAHAGKYDKYDNQLVIVITKGYNLIICKRTYEALGKPEKIMVATNPINNLVGLCGTTDSQAYTVLGVKPGPTNKNPKMGRPYLNCKAFIEAAQLQVNSVYTAYLEGGWLVVNLSQRPSSL